MPKFNLKEFGGTCVDFMSFLDTRYEGAKNEKNTTLFVKTHLNDGIIYAIQNGDIENIKILINPTEAIDRYCEYVLMTGKTDFDFSPYFKSLELVKNDIISEKKRFIYDRNKSAIFKRKVY